MAKTYRSKLGPEIIITLSIVLGCVLALVVYERNWLGIATVSGTILFVVHLILTTYYQIKGEQLTIKSGLFFNRTLDIKTIKKVIATRNIISAPAISPDRLELIYNRHNSMMVSPKDRIGFINDLLAVKPAIELDV